MATLEELVVSLVAETSGLRAELDKATKATTAATEKMDKAIEGFSENSSKNVGFFETSMATMTGFLASQAVLGAFDALRSAASFLFQELLVEGVAAATETQAAMTRLNTALALSGQYSKQASKDFEALAGEIQSTTGLGDDAVLSNIALLASLTKLDNEGLKKATLASVDLSKAIGIDLESATRLVGKAANGNVEAFTRYGITIEKGKNNTESFNNALNKLAQFQNTAKNQAQSFSGQTAILTQNWSDLTKVVGKAVIENNTLVEVMKKLNSMVSETTGELSQNDQAYKQLIGEGIVMFIDAIGIAVTTLDLMVRSIQFVMGALGALMAPIFAAVAGIEYLTNGADAAKKVMSDWATTVEQDLSAFGETGDGALKMVADRLAELSVAGQTGLQNLKEGLATVEEPANAAGDAVKTLTDTQLAHNEAIKEFSIALAEQTTNIGAEYEYQLELLNLSLENQLLSHEEFAIAKAEVLANQEASELAILQDALNKKLITAEQYSNARTGVERKFTLEKKKLENEQYAFEAQKQKEREQNFRSTLGTIATLAQSSSKELAAIGKAAAISQATIDGYAAVQKALASAPPPINFALAAAVGVATAANVAKIAGVGLNKGGTLVGGGANQDTVQASLTKGETVIDRNTTDKLQEFLNGATQQNESMKIEISLKDELVEFIEMKIIERQRTGTSLLQGV